MNNQTLVNSLQQTLGNGNRCKHLSHWGTNGYTCITAAKLLKAELDKPQPIVPTAAADLFYNQFINNSYYYSNSGCMSAGDKDVIQTLVKLVALHPPSDQIILGLIEFPCYDICYKNIPKNVLVQYIDIIITNRLKYSYLYKTKDDKGSNDCQLIDAVLNNIDLDSNLILKLVSCASYYLQMS